MTQGDREPRKVCRPWARARESAGQLVVTIDDLRSGQALLRSNGSTTQAGFTSERIPSSLFSHRPILIDDGEQHLEHRRQLVRFFSPQQLETRHRAFVESTAEQLVGEARRAGHCQVDELALVFSVTVASEIVGLTAGHPRRLAQRLEAFLEQPPVEHRRADHGRTRMQWARAAQKALAPLVSFYFHDVRPAIRARSVCPEEDVITHLLQHGYTRAEILVECLTYGTAGMVTTREFMSMALLSMLESPALRVQYLQAPTSRRIRILNELVRLEPPVSHLYRRVRDTSPGCPYAPRTFIDVDIRAANSDPGVFRPQPVGLCPDRELPAAERTGLSFGDGAHRCPGSYLAIMETDVLLTSLLRAGVCLGKVPTRHFNSLVQGYQLRNFTVEFPA